jgi:hypothetical protein
MFRYSARNGKKWITRRYEWLAGVHWHADRRDEPVLSALAPLNNPIGFVALLFMRLP